MTDDKQAKLLVIAFVVLCITSVVLIVFSFVILQHAHNIMQDAQAQQREVFSYFYPATKEPLCMATIANEIVHNETYAQQTRRVHTRYLEYVVNQTSNESLTIEPQVLPCPQ
jgi:hypothetical protein